MGLKMDVDCICCLVCGLLELLGCREKSFVGVVWPGGSAVLRGWLKRKTMKMSSGSRFNVCVSRV